MEHLAAAGIPLEISPAVERGDRVFAATLASIRSRRCATPA